MINAPKYCTFHDGKFDCTGTTRLSRYSSEMKALNAAYRLAATTAGNYNENAQYLFVLPGAKTDESLSLSGDMPRGKQFGYLFGTPNAQTAAHELGHGIFRLAHTFDSSYGYPESTTSNLMDYSGGTDLVKYQWDILHDTGIAGWLDDSEEAESVANTNLNIDGAKIIDGNLVAFITSDLKMPTVKIKINSATNNTDNTTFKVSYKLNCHVKYSYTPYASHYGNEEYDDSKNFETITSSAKEILLKFEDTLSGGDLIINWEYGTLTGTTTVLIRGENPLLVNIQTYGQTVGSNDYWFFWNLMKIESGGKQFMFKQTIDKTSGEKGKYSPIDEKKEYDKASHKAEQVGKPLWGYPSGYGLKQLDYSGNSKYNDPKYRWNWQENLKGGIEVIKSKLDAKGNSELKKYLKLINNNDKLLMDDFTIGSYTFTLGNNFTYFPSYDLKKAVADGKKSFFDAALIQMYNGGCIIEGISNVTKQEVNPKTNKLEDVTYSKITIKSKYITDNTDKKKRPYLFKVLDQNKN